MPEPTAPTPSSAGPVELAPGICVPEGAVAFAYSTSRGPGGQNVNKRLTKAELRIALADIPLPTRALARLRILALGRTTSDDELLITADEFRSQRANRQACLDRLRELIVRASVIPKARKPTRPTRGSVQRRLEAKKRRSAAKGARRPHHGEA